MIGITLVLFGFGLLVAGWLLLRRSGPGWRVGRLLSAAPRRDLAELTALAQAGEEVYIRTDGRIDSDEEFPADDGKPLVYRRRRLQRAVGRRGWETFDDERLAVPFGLVERGERVSIDIDALGDGLVVVPRESVGVAGDLHQEHTTSPLPEVPPDTPVRLRVEQVSAVDHATAAGVPRLDEDGSVVLGPGLGRPLLLTTLERDEAMRVLAGGRRVDLLVAAGTLAGGIVGIGLGVIAYIFGL